ncbi:MAG: hypothetical protein LBN39_08350 [Planctomycetaceae bacterium]|jgi:hypothetical protein|nr:hypothetical protein [Planctomycetaceae bacterium]
MDGDFEAASSGSVSSSDLVSLRTGAVVIKGRHSSTGWQTPDQGSIGGSEVHSGSAAAQVIDESRQYRLFSQDIPLKEIPVGTKLHLSAWVKGKDLAKGPESWQVGCVRFMAIVDGKTEYISSPNLLGTFDWRQETVEFIVPEKLRKLSVQVGSNGASGTVWIDEVDVSR